MNSRIVYILFLITAGMLSAGSQVLLKKAAQKEYESFIRQYLNVCVIVAYGLFFLVVIINTYVLRFVPMVIVNPIAETVPYILSFFSGFLFFKEGISGRKILGTIIILIGIIVMVS